MILTVNAVAFLLPVSPGRQVGVGGPRQRPRQVALPQPAAGAEGGPAVQGGGRGQHGGASRGSRPENIRRARWKPRGGSGI